MIKRMIFMLIFVIILFGVVFTLKGLQAHAQKEARKKNENPIQTVSSTTVKSEQWRPILNSVGSARTVKGVYITTELGGMLTHIYFTPGTFVKKGQLLAQLDIRPDVAKLHELEAQARFAKITYFRNQKQYKIGAVSKEELDSNESQYKSTAAEVVEQKAIIAKKTIYAPFSGKLGVRLVNLGEYINPGDHIAILETLNPIYMDFYFPQEDLPKLQQGQTIEMTVSTYPKKTFTGTITTVNPNIDVKSRNVEVEATIQNADHLLLPGMFTHVNLITGAPKTVLTLPQTALTFNSYGDEVYALQKTSQMDNGKTVYKAVSQFVVTGEKRGDQIVITKGLKVGQEVVSSGQMKIKNGSLVVINNRVQPSDDPNPTVPNE